MSEGKYQTLLHISRVRDYINKCICRLQSRGEHHDESKLHSPEEEIFEKYTPKLKNTTYGSPEYLRYLDKMKVALDHHYKNNRHHPNYFNNDFSQMSLFDLTEMLCDWLASTERHNDGDIYLSLTINKERFNMPEEIYRILLNTVDEIKNK